ncbi:MAG: aldehyde ferredoxin oxidoreductase [Actinobacteria bacterium HGW-Actinobacteria-7]|nr:MAG: aldehyde ferredoxin oxidoreductase [Actinobacteria bacterium HGW-Actinobacteria-7]
MTEWHGYCGRVLYVDLSEQTYHVEELDVALARDFIGGRGLGARLLFDLAPPDVAPLSPEAPLIFATGPLTGTKAPTSGRFSLTGKSPLTGTVLDTNCGGAFGARLKGAGYDALVVTGASSSLSTLEIDAEGVRFVAADALAGAEVSRATTALLEGRTGVSAAVIGSAGEREVLLATIMVDNRRALGRGGMGAVMGSKKIKGIVVSGLTRPSVAHPEDLEFFLYEVKKTLSANPITSTALPRFGTAMLVGVLGKRGLMPAMNYREPGGAFVDGLSGERLADEFLVKRAGCWGCPIVCGRQTRTAKGEGHGPEYETIWALGANLGIDSLEAVVDLNYLCNELGLDTISVGGTIAAAIELAEEGLLAEGPRRGDSASVADAIRALGARKGEFGEAAASGARALCASFARPDIAMEVKGLELPAYDPRGMQGQGLGYATSNRGGCHLRGNMLGFEVLGTPKLVDPAATGGKAGLLIVAQHLGAALDSLSLCKFSSFALSEEHYARLFSAVTGFEMGGQELLGTGERIWNLERLYNNREGFTAADDRLPTRLLEDANAAGQVVDLAPMLEEYYRFRGWNGSGVPRSAKLEQLGLSELAGAV